MKKQLTMTLAIIAALVAVSASATAYAQNSRRVSVEIPFAFVAGGERLPAGRYTVSRISRDSEKMLLIRSEDGREAATVLTNSAGAGDSASAELSFRQYGDQFFLARVWVPGSASARELPKSGAEKRLRRELRQRAQSEGRTDDSGEGKVVTVKGELR